ncbi:MAG: chemotaxis protein CheA [Anaerolineales bacterium]
MDFLAGEFLQDFLDESDGHLRAITTYLLALEESGGAQPEAETIAELFRAFHTLKGLCGMVGLSDASELAHVMESLLRAIRQGERTFTPELIDALLEGTQFLQALIEQVRTPDNTAPEFQPVVQRLRQLAGLENAPQPPYTPDVPPELPAAPALWLPPEVRPHLSAEDLRQIENALQQGQTLFLPVFVPSDERAARGVNVTKIRADLETAGRVLCGIPLIENQNVRFAFILLAEAPLDPAAFPDLTWLPARPPQEVESPPTTVPAVAARPPVGGGIAPSMRVEISRMDEILQLVGDLVVTRSQLHQALRHLPPGFERETFTELENRLERQMRLLREAVMRTRMVPLSEVFGRMPLAVRDMARQNEKQVALRLEGERTEVDKSLVEQLLDPLLHLVRNAVTHGIETPAERQAAGKPPQGTIVLRGQPDGEHIRIEVQDDGRGVDFQAVAEKAVRLGLLDRPRELNAAEALELICRSGFSTRSQADMGAGRGVGMDVVAAAITTLGGTLSMQTAPGQGTTFVLRLPLSLTIFDALIIQTGAEHYAVPRDVVQHILEISPQRITQLEGQAWYPLGEQAAPLISLTALFGRADGAQGRYGLVLPLPGQTFILQVDALIGMQEIVMRAMHDPLTASAGIAGATELGDGRLVLVLDAGGLTRLYNGGL